MTDFLVVFGILGLFFIPVILLFIIKGVDIAHKVCGSLVCLVFWVLVTVSLCIQNSANEEEWNGGYCKCGTHWELIAATEDKRGDITKFYSCPNCYTEITQ